MDWLFVGDAHFSSGDGERRKHFFNFIQENKSTLKTLVIMGDFFDFWFGFRNLAPLKKEYGDVLTFFRKLKSNNVEMIYFEGNHEFRLGSFLSNKLGIKVYENCAEMNIDGKKSYLAHGDRSYPTVSHRILTWLLRNRLSYLLISLLGPRIVIGVATWWSANSRNWGQKRSTDILSRMRKFAQLKVNEGFDTVILAHTHLPEAIALKKGKREGYYFNVGNWMRDYSYLRYSNKKGFSLEYYNTE
ncbi:MAG: metallophosphoesterase [Deltaproteobacteria bacterium]|nr:metallophosphoesterase [Deltaproteobacteria bacterium]